MKWQYDPLEAEIGAGLVLLHLKDQRRVLVLDSLERQLDARGVQGIANLQLSRQVSILG